MIVIKMIMLIAKSLNYKKIKKVIQTTVFICILIEILNMIMFLPCKDIHIVESSVLRMLYSFPLKIRL